MHKIREWFIVNTGYVRQLAKSYYNELTVRENLIFSMSMQAQKGMKLSQKLERVEQVIRETGLVEQADIKVGDGIGLGLSGGQVGWGGNGMGLGTQVGTEWKRIKGWDGIEGKVSRMGMGLDSGGSGWDPGLGWSDRDGNWTRTGWQGSPIPVSYPSSGARTTCSDVEVIQLLGSHNNCC